MSQTFGSEITLDWDTFELILFNLVQNSVKYNCKSGFIVIVAEVDKKEEMAKVVIRVIDTGIGIEK